MLSRTEVLYLQGQKHLSKSYEYKIRSILKKKLAKLLDNDLPLLSSLFPDLLNLTKFSKVMRSEVDKHLTKYSKKRKGLLEERNQVACKSLEGSKTYDQSQIVHAATEFSNNKAGHVTNNSNSTEKQRRERDLNPRGPHGPQAIQFHNFQACALPG